MFDLTDSDRTAQWLSPVYIVVLCGSVPMAATFSLQRLNMVMCGSNPTAYTFSF